MSLICPIFRTRAPIQTSTMHIQVMQTMRVCCGNELHGDDDSSDGALMSLQIIEYVQVT